MLETMWALNFSAILTIILYQLIQCAPSTGCLTYQNLSIPDSPTINIHTIYNSWYYFPSVENRKAKENEMLRNEEVVKKFMKLQQELRSQVRAAITLFLVSGIDVLANLLLPVFQVVFYAIAGPISIYALWF